jgi:hypothetical protein
MPQSGQLCALPSTGALHFGHAMVVICFPFPVGNESLTFELVGASQVFKGADGVVARGLWFTEFNFLSQHCSLYCLMLVFVRKVFSFRGRLDGFRESWSAL